MANTKFEVILRMPFLKISNANMTFDEKILRWKFYITNKALSTTKQVQLVNPKNIVIAALDVDSKTFIVHVAIREQKEMPVHSKKQAQVGTLLFDKVSTAVLAEYSDYSNVFSAKNAAELLKNTGMNEHTIEPTEGK